MFPNCPTPQLKKYINLKGLPNKNLLCVHAVSLTPHVRFLRLKIDHISGEFEALARESGAQGVLFDEKKPRVENLVTLSL
jgi:hypothetical protein